MEIRCSAQLHMACRAKQQGSCASIDQQDSFGFDLSSDAMIAQKTVQGLPGTVLKGALHVAPVGTSDSMVALAGWC